jgi:hypothetical protein
MHEPVGTVEEHRRVEERDGKGAQGNGNTGIIKSKVNIIENKPQLLDSQKNNFVPGTFIFK